ncbi:MAG: hypothetical protein DMF06_05815 [Verrucomicrobia bacterium]|jgi:hypothetical protein|nr:MAG: hypothetical protein DMF06_05815 [Verrucomicrobiota bacterium]
MRAHLVIAMLLLTGCTSVTDVRGRYATALSAVDIQQIRRVAQKSSHFGHTLFLLDVVRPDRVHVRTREYQESGWSGTNIYVVRRQGQWSLDEHSEILGETERRVTIY